MQTFLSFLIITYRRPEKVERLLRLFLDQRWQELSNFKFEIVIADDHGEDNTFKKINPVIKLLKEQNWKVSYIYREKNLRGDRNLYNGYTKDSSGEYVWFLCDDDIVDVGEAILYIQTIHQKKPLISICGFTQGRNNQHGNFFGGENRLIDNFSDSVRYLVKFPKTTAYIMRRCPETNLDQEFERWDNTLYSWIGIAIYLMAKKNESLLIYPKTVAFADSDYGLLRYSYRVFLNLYFVTKDSIEVSGLSNEENKQVLNELAIEDELTLCIDGLKAHYSWRTEICYEAKILQEEIKFLKKNKINIFTRKKRILSFCKFIIYFLGSYVFSS